MFVEIQKGKKFQSNYYFEDHKEDLHPHSHDIINDMQFILL